MNGKVQYDLLARTLLFQQGLDRTMRGSSKHRIALMCAERDPLTCHRTILVCRHLVTRGLAVRHILESGRIETHDEALTRLLAELGIADRELFRSREDLVQEAYTRRAQQIAYVEKPPPADQDTRGLAQ